MYGNYDDMFMFTVLPILQWKTSRYSANGR